MEYWEERSKILLIITTDLFLFSTFEVQCIIFVYILRMCEITFPIKSFQKEYKLLLA